MNTHERKRRISLKLLALIILLVILSANLIFIHSLPAAVVGCNLVPDATSIPRGGVLGIQGTVTNNTGNTGSVLFGTKVTLPSGNWYPSPGYLYGPITVSLNPYQSKSQHLSHDIPITASLGTYIYHGYVGNYGVGIYDECTFNFQVIESLPAAPSNLSATTVSYSQINLSWSDNSTNETGFKIERKTGAAGTYSQIGTVGANIATYSDMGLTAGTTYYYRIKAYNSSGDSAFSNEASATTTALPITLTIDSPLDGATINGPSVMVKGTVANSGGSETGVSVNGIVSNIYGNQFTANRVPLEEGTNIITATATDTHGHTATASITVNAVTTGNYIRLSTDTESGIAPLEATLTIDGSFSITNSTINVTGPAQPQIVNVSPSEYTVTITIEGIYYFTATVTGPDGNQYQDKIVITVVNRTQLDNLLKSIWNEIKTALISQDINSALNYFISDSRQLYNGIFTALSAQLPQLVQDMQDIQLIYVKNNNAKYRLRRSELCGGQMFNITYYIYFAVDENGTWKIYKF